MGEVKSLYVSVSEVQKDWGISKSAAYRLIKKLSEQMHAENPKLIVMSGKINRLYYEEACMKR